MIKNNKQIGLALGEGGPRGLAHIGIIKALEENNIPIDLITGSSAGALIGGLYTVNKSIEEIEKIALSITLKEMTSILSDVGSASGIIRGDKFEAYLEEYCQKKTLETLDLPFYPLATDLSTGKEFVIKNGSIAKAIHASCAIPGIFASIEWENKILVDGAISSLVPVETAKKIGADFVIAVNLNSYSFNQTKSKQIAKPKISTIGISAIEILQSNLAKEKCEQADVIILPDVDSIPSLNLRRFINGADIIEKRYQECLKLIPEIEEKMNKDLT